MILLFLFLIINIKLFEIKNLEIGDWGLGNLSTRYHIELLLYALHGDAPVSPVSLFANSLELVRVHLSYVCGNLKKKEN